MILPLACIAALALDARFGERRRKHPLVLFGALARRLEGHFNAVEGRGWRSHGATAWCLAVLPLTGLAYLLCQLPYVGSLVDVLLLSLALGLKSLGQHALPIAQALRQGDLLAARLHLSRLVSRQTEHLEPGEVARGATESVLENGSEAVFASLFWFALLGGPGVVLYRLSNTLDALWGHRTPRFLRFGWAAARIDDLLNYVPARLVAMTYALLGKTVAALRCWHQQAPQWDSPNAGPVMAAGAGALQVRLGGATVYQGMLEQRPDLGEGAEPQARDIERALNLVNGGVLLWLFVLCLGGLVFA